MENPIPKFTPVELIRYETMALSTYLSVIIQNFADVNGLTRKQFADKLGLTERKLKNYMVGNKTIDLTLLAMVSQAFRVRFDVTVTYCEPDEVS